MIDRYSRPEFAALWSDASRFAAWLEVELAACEAMEAAGVVPEGQAALVRMRAAGKLSVERIQEIERITRHDVIAFLTHVEELAGEPARWLHLGMTSSDVLDTALALQCREALGRILDGVDDLRAACATRAREHERTPAIGRSHGIHAEPITAGLVFARWYAELGRARLRIERAREAISVGKIAGAVGTYGNIAPDIEAAALGALGLLPETVATQVVARDRHADVLIALAMLGTAIEQIAVGVRHWQRTEVGEAEEGFGKGQKGSSAMPHKKNPILSENLTGLARLLRAYAGASLESVTLWHERDISHSSVERVALPDATILADFMLARTTGVIRNLVVHPERMRQNLELSGGLCFSEAVLLALVRKGLPRQTAYEMVQRCALAAHAGKGDFRELLAADPDVSSRLSAAELAAAFDLDHHLRHVSVIFQRIFGQRIFEDSSMPASRLDAILKAQLTQTLDATDLPALGEKHEGKVRDSYVRGGSRVIVVTDRLSAFDVIIGTIPFKGQVLNQLAQYWFEETAGLAPNHVIRVPDPNVMIVRECRVLPAEFVMRAYLTGVTETSIWWAYERGARAFCGHALPEGMKKNQRLPAPILTPSTKAPKGQHDISREELLDMGTMRAAEFDRAAALAHALFAFGQRRAAERGLILVDTKYEFGVSPEGEILVIDEIHTPDSSRYWYADDYQERLARGQEPRSLDKEYVRRWLVEQAGYRGQGAPPALPDEVRIEAARRYIDNYELITGRPFVPDTTEPARRIAASLDMP
jgi:adenylosuccinate lyase